MSARHPSWTTMVESLLGRATSRQESALRRHLDGGCESCRGEYREVERIVGAIRRDRLEEPPDLVLERAVSAVRDLAEHKRSRTTRASAIRAAAEAVVERLARLVTDTAADPLPAGVRGAVAEARQLLFESEEWDIDLAVEEGAIRGQILGRGAEAFPPAGTEVEFTRGRHRERVPANAEGAFRFAAVPRGEIELIVNIPGEGAVRLPRMAYLPD